MEGKNHRCRQQGLALALWAVFTAGLIVQLFAPRLQVSHRAFVMPEALLAPGNTIRPDELVAKERRMQLLSAVLTTTGALGLAVHYRHALLRGT